MQERKDSHLNTDKQGRNSNLQVWVCQCARRFDDTESRRGKHTKQESLPEGEENYQFNGGDLQEWVVISKIFPQLNIELDQAEHGDRNRRTLNDQNLARLAMT